jgi:ATP-dependent Lon protease
MKEKYEKIDVPRTKSELKKIKKAEKKKAKKQKEQDDDDAVSVKVESEYTELLELKKDLSKKLEKNPKSKILQKALRSCVESMRDLVRTARKKNVREYNKLINGGEKKPNEMNYFKKQLSNVEQMRVMADLKEINSFINIDKPYRLAILESKMPAKLKAHAFQKLNQLNMMDSCDPEYYKIKNWVDSFMRIPFCNYNSLSVNVSDGLDVCHTFMADAKKTLDECVYGLDDAKLQIMQMIGQWITNPDAMGTAIAIKGPPGTGKTTLVKDGISKILGREFVFIPLGGTGDASYLEGHSYTYEGSTWGKVVQSLMTCGSMNPVFFFDELDKLSETPKGEEVTGILTHMTDTTQNSQFHDKYFSEIDFDLSKCLFIFSYNDESKVNPILKDRMYRILTKGYDTKEKIVIAKEHLLPKIREQVSFAIEDVIIPDDTLQYIITTESLTQGESGVRNLKRCLEIIHTKLNLFRLMKPDINLFEKEMKVEVKFPFTVTRKHVDLFIKNEESNKSVLYSLYV